MCHHNIVTFFAAFVAASSYTYELLLSLHGFIQPSFDGSVCTCWCILTFIITAEAQFSVKCHCRTSGECNHHYSELSQHCASCLLTHCCIILFIFSIYKHLAWSVVAEHLEVQLPILRAISAIWFCHLSYTPVAYEYTCLGYVLPSYLTLPVYSLQNTTPYCWS